jgi:hypothetical protein
MMILRPIHVHQNNYWRGGKEDKLHKSVACMEHVIDVYIPLVCDPKETNPHGTSRRRLRAILKWVLLKRA